jgi:hypothetical protein
MSNWQPIETAPKDGRAILLLSMEYSVEDPWDKDGDGNPIVHVHRPRCNIGHWDAKGTSWVDETGSLDGPAYDLAVTGFWLSGGGWFQPNEVSHWMPLPDPP